MNNPPFVVDEDNGRQNMYATEPRTYFDPQYTNHANVAEIANARWAMIGFVAAIGAYSITGQVLPGVF